MSEQNIKAEVVAAVAQPSRLSQIIEDPFASAIAASAATLSALAVVLSSMWLINSALGG